MSDFDDQYRASEAVFGVQPEPLLMRFAAEIRPGGRVLDVGVGQGRNAFPLARAGLHVLGIDPSGVAIDGCRAIAEREGLGDRIELATTDVFDLAPDAPFDAILLFGLLQILEPPRMAELVARVGRWTHAGSLLFVTAWHTGDPAYSMLRAGAPRLGPQSFRNAAGHVRTFLEPSGICALFPESAGWTPLHHAEGLGPWHRHGDSPRERHGTVSFVARRGQLGVIMAGALDS